MEKAIQNCKATEQEKLQMQNFRNEENQETVKEGIAQQNMLRPIQKST